MTTANPQVRIVSDSTCNLPAALIERYAISLVPIVVMFGDESYREGVDIQTDEFYTRIRRTGIVPRTSQPAAGEFAEVYHRLAQEPGPLLSIHLTGRLSGVLASAYAAKQMVPEADLELFDTLAVSIGSGFCVLQAARMAEAGAAREQIVARLGQIRDRLNLFLTPETLKYLQASGRIGKLQGVLASLLNVKPIIRCKDGLLDAFERVRTRSVSLERLVELTVETVGTQDLVDVAVIHADARAEAEALADRLRGVLNCREVFVETLSLALGVHGGPGMIGIYSYRV